MEDPRTADGVEHLQAAARELLLAARSFLNVVEEVVEDRDRFAGAASGVVDLLRDGLAGVVPGPSSPLQPWEEAAWRSRGTDVPDDGDRSHDDGAPDDGVPDDTGTVAAAPGATLDGKRPAPTTAPGRATAGSATAGTARRRVRRISVD